MDLCPGDFQVICDSMVGEIRRSSATTETHGNMRSNLAKLFGVIRIATRAVILAQEVIMLNKTVKFYPEIFAFKVFVRSNN